MSRLGISPHVEFVTKNRHRSGKSNDDKEQSHKAPQITVNPIQRDEASSLHVTRLVRISRPRLETPSNDSLRMHPFVSWAKSPQNNVGSPVTGASRTPTTIRSRGVPDTNSVAQVLSSALMKTAPAEAAAAWPRVGPPEGKLSSRSPVLAEFRGLVAPLDGSNAVAYRSLGWLRFISFYAVFTVGKRSLLEIGFL